MLALMAIRDWPSDERPREKLLDRGAAALSDAEILPSCSARNRWPLGLGSCPRGTRHFGSLRHLLGADRARFCASAGLGLARYAESGRRRVRGGNSRSRCASDLCSASPKATRDFLRARLRDLEHEVFCCLYLDKRHRLIHFEELFRGTIDGASVHPREIVKLALQRNAAAVIVAHNHPSGIAEPSQADELITQRVKEALALVDIRLLDHIIIGDGICVSLAERGLV